MNQNRLFNKSLLVMVFLIVTTEMILILYAFRDDLQLRLPCISKLPTQDHFMHFLKSIGLLDSSWSVITNPESCESLWVQVLKEHFHLPVPRAVKMTVHWGLFMLFSFLSGHVFQVPVFLWIQHFEVLITLFILFQIIIFLVLLISDIICKFSDMLSMP